MIKQLLHDIRLTVRLLQWAILFLVIADAVGSGNPESLLGYLAESVFGAPPNIRTLRAPTLTATPTVTLSPTSTVTPTATPTATPTSTPIATPTVTPDPAARARDVAFVTFWLAAPACLGTFLAVGMLVLAVMLLADRYVQVQHARRDLVDSERARETERARADIEARRTAIVRHTIEQSAR